MILAENPSVGGPSGSQSQSPFLRTYLSLSALQEVEMLQ